MSDCSNQLAYKLKEIRLLKKMSRKDVAQKLNISLSTYGNYEIGVREPNIDMLIRLADVFDVTLDYLVGRQTPQKPSPMNILALSGISFSKDEKGRIYCYDTEAIEYLENAGKYYSPDEEKEYIQNNVLYTTYKDTNTFSDSAMKALFGNIDISKIARQALIEQFRYDQALEVLARVDIDTTSLSREQAIKLAALHKNDFPALLGDWKPQLKK